MTLHRSEERQELTLRRRERGAGRRSLLDLDRRDAFVASCGGKDRLEIVSSAIVFGENGQRHADAGGKAAEFLVAVHGAGGVKGRRGVVLPIQSQFGSGVF